MTNLFSEFAPKFYIWVCQWVSSSRREPLTYGKMLSSLHVSEAKRKRKRSQYWTGLSARPKDYAREILIFMNKPMPCEHNSFSKDQSEMRICSQLARSTAGRNWIKQISFRLLQVLMADCTRQILFWLMKISTLLISERKVMQMDLKVEITL